MRIAKGSKICAKLVPAGTACDFAGWNPNATLLTIVANGSGGQVPAGDGIFMDDPADKGSQYQGAFEILTDNVTDSYPPIITVPIGQPGNPVGTAVISPRANYSS